LKKKIIILGKNGQLAKSLTHAFKKHKFDHKNISSTIIDFNKPSEVKKKLEKYKPLIIINCFAYTNVDEAENDKKKCFNINVNSLSVLADFCRRNKIFLIHFSSDYIFDSKIKKPLLENSIPKPINYYGKTKLLGEKKIIHSKCKYFIFRLSWTYSIFGNNFLKSITRKLNNKNKIKVISDQLGCPTNLEFVSEIMIEFIKLIFLGNIKSQNIFNISSEKTTSWYKFAKLIEKSIYPKRKTIISKTFSYDYKSLAKRPYYSKLSNRKLKSILKNYKFKSWDDLAISFIQKNKRELLKL
jgi:dTDP-4-dehydrorhamnose reductase